MPGRNLSFPNQLFELQGYRQRVVPLERNGPVVTPIGADPASDAPTFLDPAAVPGGGQHGSPGAVGIHGPAAAGTTVADGVKASLPCRMNTRVDGFKGNFCRRSNGFFVRMGQQHPYHSGSASSSSNGNSGQSNAPDAGPAPRLSGVFHSPAN